MCLRDRLAPVLLLQEPVQGCQHNSHAQIVRIDKVERLCHCYEDLVINAVGHALLAHPLCHSQLVLLLNITLPAHNGRQQPQSKLDLQVDKK